VRQALDRDSPLSKRPANDAPDQLKALRKGPWNPAWYSGQEKERERQRPDALTSDDFFSDEGS
jgi:hypothetical protein